MSRSLNCTVGWLVVLGSFVASDALAAVITYDAQLNTFPAAQGWTDTAGGAGVDSLTGGTLIVTDTDSGNAHNLYRFNTVMNPETAWQMRAHVALQGDYVGSGTTGPGAIYNQLISDSDGGDAVAGGVYGFGMLYNSGLNETRVFFRGSNNASGFVAVTGTPTLDITLTKTNGGNPAGRGDDSMLLEVYQNNILQGTLLGTLDGGLIGNDGEYAEFGNFNGAPSGTFVLTWATFGIGEAAPVIQIFTVPEPSTMMLATLGGLGLVYRRRRGTTNRNG